MIKVQKVQQRIQIGRQEQSCGRRGERGYGRAVKMSSDKSKSFEAMRETASWLEQQREIVNHGGPVGFHYNQTPWLCLKSQSPIPETQLIIPAAPEIKPDFNTPNCIRGMTFGTQLLQPDFTDYNAAGISKMKCSWFKPCRPWIVSTPTICSFSALLTGRVVSDKHISEQTRTFSSIPGYVSLFELTCSSVVHFN